MNASFSYDCEAGNNRKIAGEFDHRSHQRDSNSHNPVPLPLVSIRCLAYNHERYIARALDSFLMQQTTFPFEILVHDDASTDGTAAIIRSYAERFPEKIRPIYEEENLHSLHDGLMFRKIDAQCRGRYIATIDGDDYWTDPEKLQRQVEVMEADPSLSICFCRVQVIDAKTTQDDRAIQDNPVFKSEDHQESGSGKCQAASPGTNDSIDSIMDTIPRSWIPEGKVTLRDYTNEEFLHGRWCFQTSSFLIRKSVLDAYDAAFEAGILAAARQEFRQEFTQGHRANCFLFHSFISLNAFNSKAVNSEGAAANPSDTMRNISGQIVRQTRDGGETDRSEESGLGRMLAIFPYGDMPTLLFALLQGDGWFIDETMSVYRKFSGGYNSEMQAHPERAIRDEKKLIRALTAFNTYTERQYEEAIQARIARGRKAIARLQLKRTCPRLYEGLRGVKRRYRGIF